MHTPFKYLGYKGVLSNLASDHLYTGIVDQIPDQVTFEAASLSILQANFEAAVDEYIELRRQIDSEVGANRSGECQLFVHVTDQPER